MIKYCGHIIIRWIPIFVGSWVQVNHELKGSTSVKFYIGLYADFGKTTKSDIPENASFL